MSDQTIITPLPNLGNGAHSVQYSENGSTATVINSGQRNDHLTVHSNGVVHFHGQWEDAWRNNLLSQTGNVLNSTPFLK